MKYLVGIFIAMAIFGMLTGHVGAGLLAVFMAGLTHWGARQLNKREAEFNADPRNAKSATHTLQALNDCECECMRDNI